MTPKQYWLRAIAIWPSVACSLICLVATVAAFNTGDVKAFAYLVLAALPWAVVWRLSPQWKRARA